MIEMKKAALIDFRPVKLEDKEKYEAALAKEEGRGCEFSFANLYLWGRQNIAFSDEGIMLFSQFNKKSVYPYPLAAGDMRCVIDAIIADAKERGIPCRITGLSRAAKEKLCELYPGKFSIHHDEGSYDYVYSIHDLADLPGKKYHGKRGHLKNFYAENPDFSVLDFNDESRPLAEALAQRWYFEKTAENPNSDYIMEQVALKKAFRDYKALGMKGIVLTAGGRAVAFALGSFLSADTFDVNFEKGLSEVKGSYAAVNCEFAKYLRSHYPCLEYIDREEDMGLEGLRRAKRSYHPHHMIEKFWAHLLEEGYEY